MKANDPDFGSHFCLFSSLSRVLIDQHERSRLWVVADCSSNLAVSLDSSSHIQHSLVGTQQDD